MSKLDAPVVAFHNHNISHAIVHNIVNTNNEDKNIAGPSDASIVSVKVSMHNQSSKRQKFNFEDELCEGI